MSDGITFTAQPIVGLSGQGTPWLELFASIDGIAGNGWHDIRGDALRTATIATLEALAGLGPALTGPEGISVNIGPDAITGEVGEALLAAADKLARPVAVEVLETGPLSGEALDTLNTWQRAGIRLLVDDYGTGHADAHRLDLLDWDGVKLSAPLVDAAGRGNRTALRKIGEIVVRYPFVVAEGLEHPAARGNAVRFGAGYGQGWLWGRPHPVGEGAGVRPETASS